MNVPYVSISFCKIIVVFYIYDVTCPEIFIFFSMTSFIIQYKCPKRIWSVLKMSFVHFIQLDTHDMIIF